MFEDVANEFSLGTDEIEVFRLLTVALLVMLWRHLQEAEI